MTNVANRAATGWAVVAGGCLIVGSIRGHNYPALYVWSTLTLVICIGPVIHLLLQRLSGTVSRTVVGLPNRYSLPAQRRIGGILIQQGLLTNPQLDALLDLQATTDQAWQRLGDLAVQQGYITAEDLRAALGNEPRPVTMIGPPPDLVP